MVSRMHNTAIDINDIGRESICLNDIAQKTPSFTLYHKAGVAKRTTAVDSRSILAGVQGFESLPPHSV